MRVWWREGARCRTLSVGLVLCKAWLVQLALLAGLEPLARGDAKLWRAGLRGGRERSGASAAHLSPLARICLLIGQALMLVMRLADGGVVLDRFVRWSGSVLPRLAVLSGRALMLVMRARLRWRSTRSPEAMELLVASAASGVLLSSSASLACCCCVADACCWLARLACGALTSALAEACCRSAACSHAG